MNFLTSLDNYNIFYEVAKTKNITKASKNLFISQPAVTQAIKKLEQNLDTILFIRSKKGMELTRVGQEIYNKVETALNNFSIIEEMIAAEKGLIRGELNIGSGSNIFRRVLSESVACFTQDYESVKLNHFENVQTKMIEDLKNGKLQIVLTQQNEDINFKFIPLLETKYVFVQSCDCQCNKFITSSEGAFSKELFDKFINAKGLNDVPILQVGGYKSGLDLVLRGIGTTLVPDYLAEDYIKEGSLKIVYDDFKLPSITFGVYYNEDLITPALKKFLEYI